MDEEQKSEWQSGYDAGARDAVCEVATYLVREIYTSYRTAEQRRVARNHLRQVGLILEALNVED